MVDPRVIALRKVNADIAAAAHAAGRSPGNVGLVAVSKTQTAEMIEPVLDAGHRVFGENRMQEAMQKWPELRRTYPDVELHLIGPLQSNKVAEAVALFNVIQTVDREKIASALAREMKSQGQYPRLFVQVNTGEEPQKAGILPSEADHFLHRLHHGLGLEISGLMCLPPLGEEPVRHFRLLADIALRNSIPELSMGMSGDFAAAIQAGATLVRIGTAIFGDRPAANPPVAR